MTSVPERSIFDILAVPLPAPSKRDAILASGALTFVRHGYEGASMELVAQGAGAARRTVYNQFPEGKKQLFHAVTARMWKSFPVMDIAADEEALSDPHLGLRRIGYGIAAFWSSPLSIKFLRMVIGESARFPELMEGFFAFGKTSAVTAVTDYVRALDRRNLIQAANPLLASRQFLGLIDESVLWSRVMGDAHALTPDDAAQVVEQAVDIFLGHYQRKAIPVRS